MARGFPFFRRGGNKTATNKTKNVDGPPKSSGDKDVDAPPKSDKGDGDAPPKSSGDKDVDAPNSSGGGKNKSGGFGGGTVGNIMNIALLSSMFIPFENLFGGGNGNSAGMSPEDLKRQEQLIQQAVPLISCCCCSLSSFLSLVLFAVLLMG